MASKALFITSYFKTCIGLIISININLRPFNYFPSAIINQFFHFIFCRHTPFSAPHNMCCIIFWL